MSPVQLQLMADIGETAKELLNDPPKTLMEVVKANIIVIEELTNNLTKNIANDHLLLIRFAYYQGLLDALRSPDFIVSEVVQKAFEFETLIRKLHEIETTQ